MVKQNEGKKTVNRGGLIFCKEKVRASADSWTLDREGTRATEIIKSSPNLGIYYSTGAIG